jgi:hypothetical protein
MNESDREQNDAQIFACDISDAALEAAANALPGAAMSFPNAPTVSVLISCCGND